jgi:hypothetical protein
LSSGLKQAVFSCFALSREKCSGIILELVLRQYVYSLHSPEEAIERSPGQPWFACEPTLYSFVLSDGIPNLVDS